MNDDSRGMYNTNSQIKFETSMLRSSLCDYSDSYILVSGTITVTPSAAGGRNNNIQLVFKNCTPFTNCISEIIRWTRDEPALTDGYAVANFPSSSAPFEFKQKIIGSTGNDGTKAVQIMVPLNFLSNFWRTLEMPLINSEINLILSWSANCVISDAVANQDTYNICNNWYKTLCSSYKFINSG